MNIKTNETSKLAALRNWVNRLRAALGEPQTCVISTVFGPTPMIGMPTLAEMGSALNMSETEMRSRMARDGLEPWDVAKEYVGADETSAMYRLR